ncbi:Transferase [Macleaya cordata]|uniref:Transferase n=1 Tax=Macleaya cordata TaxID=56857 RepID=A0A200RCQ3_MACCD|nr:Transferase [Macleaya cordata]
MKVEVISKEIIKPSLPTPQHLKTFNLSLLDQLSPSFYVPLILFYGAAAPDATDHHRSDMLKRSLSETLTRFYPVAGRIKDNNNIYVDCNDDGVDYFEVRINCTVSDFMSATDELDQLLPSHIVANNNSDVQGAHITVCMSHKIADASTLVTFINCWAATVRGATEIVYPTFDSASLFPPCRELVVSSLGPAKTVTAGMTISTREQRVVIKRFVFDAAKMAALRARIMDMASSTVKNPTRVEAVSALIWKSAMEVSRVKSEEGSLSKRGKTPIFVVNHGVNLRGRMDPPLPKVSFGNLVIVATATSTSEPRVGNHELDGLVGQLRDAINKINGDYIGKVLQSGEFLKSVANKEEEAAADKVDVEVYWMTSWCRFPVYEADFGWGKPIWVTTTGGNSLPYKNIVILIDTRCGEGIEALVTLLEEDVVLFERNLELLVKN